MLSQNTTQTERERGPTFLRGAFRGGTPNTLLSQAPKSLPLTQEEGARAKESFTLLRSSSSSSSNTRDAAKTFFSGKEKKLRRASARKVSHLLIWAPSL